MAENPTSSEPEQQPNEIHSLSVVLAGPDKPNEQTVMWAGNFPNAAAAAQHLLELRRQNPHIQIVEGKVNVRPVDEAIDDEATLSS